MNPSADVVPDALGGRLFEPDNGRRLFEASDRPSRREALISARSTGDGFPAGPGFPAAPPKNRTPKVTKRPERPGRRQQL